MALLSLLLLTDVAILAWLVAGWRKRAADHRQAYTAWITELEADPARWRLYQAHWSWKARGRVILATLLDVPLLFVLSLGPVSSLARHLELVPHRDAFFLLWLAVGLPLVLANTEGALRWYGTTLGLRLCGVVVVSSHTGRPAAHHELRYPSKWDYRRGRVLDLLFVPREELRAGS